MELVTTGLGTGLIGIGIRDMIGASPAGRGNGLSRDVVEGLIAVSRKEWEAFQCTFNNLIQRTYPLAAPFLVCWLPYRPKRPDRFLPQQQGQITTATE